ncbi:hypothetical protein FRB90_005994 [Tulasnella sp. 427]|nr:hypothetical protein FRB90_005994 [Tulasnella sp. 427]
MTYFSESSGIAPRLPRRSQFDRTDPQPPTRQIQDFIASKINGGNVSFAAKPFDLSFGCLQMLLAANSDENAGSTGSQGFRNLKSSRRIARDPARAAYEIPGCHIARSGDTHSLQLPPLHERP